MIRTLLTGFGPFGRVSENPSELLARRFRVEPALGHRLTCRVYPVCYNAAGGRLRGQLVAGVYDFAVLLGVAAGSATMRVERFAHNFDSSDGVDVAGRRGTGVEIVPGAAERLESAMDTEGLAAWLGGSGVPAVVSDDAGRFLCNHLYFIALHTILKAGLLTRCVFVHVPAHSAAAGEGAPTMPLETQEEGIRRVLEFLRA